MNKREIEYMVDWDIPVEKRRMFYYYLNKLKKKHELSGSMSTQSVMIVQDRALAKEVYLLASQYGTANLYEVTQLKGSENDTGVTRE